jgi:hypothetical protein
MKVGSYIKLSILSIAAILFVGCGGGGGGGTPEPTGIVHNGTSYGVVTSPHTGRVWLDRNLGAAQVCTSTTDVACYGDFYQWGRGFDGHQDSMSATTATVAIDVVGAGSDFIIGASDWAAGPDASGAIRYANWSRSDGGSICPAGFRVPTITELANETINASPPVANSTDAFNGFLKIPLTGGRPSTDGILAGQGMITFIWSSTTTGVGAQVILFGSGGADIVPISHRTYGLPVRCIQN